MSRFIHKIALLVAGLAVVSACGRQPDAPETQSATCVTDLSCPAGEECGDGGCVPVAPTLYPHIQLGSALLRGYLDADEMAWRATHFDALVGRVANNADQLRALNPNIRSFEYWNARHHWYDDLDNEAMNWASAHGYDGEDFYLHYKEDVEVPTWESVTLVVGFPPGVVPGWNPEWQPGDPPASAPDRASSRVFGFNSGQHEPWYMVNVTDPGLRRFVTEFLISVLDGSRQYTSYASGPIEGVMADEALYYAIYNEGLLGKSTEFFGVPLDEDHPYAVGFETLYPELAAAFHQHFGRTIDVMPNFATPYFLRLDNRCAQNVQMTTPWIWAEVWLADRGTYTPTSGSYRAITYEGDYDQSVVKIIGQTRRGGRRLLCARDLTGGGAGTSRAKLFSLALYYLLHNGNTFYMYNSVNSHAGVGHLSTWQWNPAVEFDIGQPASIPPEATDFEGMANTKEHYLFATGPDPVYSTLTYRVFARRFTNALVLVKMLPAGSVIDDRTITTHPLDGSYAVLREDGTLGDVVTTAQIRNNEGLILVPVN